MNKEKLLSITLDGTGFEVISSEESNNFQKFIFLSLDLRLLYNILKNPKKFNLNNAEIGCHISWKRIPNIYDKSLMYCLNSLHI